ncbi:RDD family protein [Yoonia sp. SS1-5]|uniref:RDD family protein n=1 Tax=Yoonia rhodophyticola TaxID=3137370 RepID=A0AAN0NL79_9RHOB
MSRKPKKSASEYAQAHRRREQKYILSITPPEGVPISFTRAGIGTRIGAQLLDLTITYGGLIALILLFSTVIAIGYETGEALFALLAFLIRIPYYILTELVWNGQTLGKKITKVRVISANGRRLDPHQVVVRNLLKEAEVFTPIMLLFGIMSSSGWVQTIMAVWLMIVLAIPIFSKQSQRLGDMIAGTCVVEVPKIKQSREITDAGKPLADTFVFETNHLDHYGRFELQSLEGILRDASTSRVAHERDVEVARTIAKKIGYTDRFSSADARKFLSSFYNAQRAHLEARQMFGDRREDKTHRARETDHS